MARELQLRELTSHGLPDHDKRPARRCFPRYISYCPVRKQLGNHNTGEEIMKTFVLSAALVLSATSMAQAQYVTYYSNPVVTSYYAEPVTSYYAPTTAYYAPTTSYYAPTTAYYSAPVTTAYSPVVSTSYYTPYTSYYTPYTSYYSPYTSYYGAPYASYYAPAYYGGWYRGPLGRWRYR